MKGNLGADKDLFQDLVCLNEDVTLLNCIRPCPSTIALISFVSDQFKSRKPLACLAYFLYLDLLGQNYGRSILNCFIRCGVQVDATNFLRRFASPKIHGLRTLALQFDDLITSQEEFQELFYALKVVAKLHIYSIQEAFDSVENPYKWGSASVELPDWLFQSKIEIASALNQGSSRIELTE
jgi:hypothetical protein